MQQFLRGPEKEMTYTRSGTFNGIKHARNFSYKYFTSSFSKPRHFSAMCEPNGRGGNAYVCITKSTEGYDKRVRAYDIDKAEAAVLFALLNSSRVGGGSSRGGGSGGSASRSCEGVTSGVGGVGGGNNLGPSFASGNASSDFARVAAAGNVDVDQRRRAKVEVVDLCDSPRGVCP